MSLDLVNNVIKFLKEHTDEKFTARQIAEWFLTTFPKECEIKLQNSPFLENQTELLNQIISEIGARRSILQKRCSGFKTTEGRPRKYYYTEKTETAEVEALENIKNLPSLEKTKEHDLYQLLSHYLLTELNVHSKRIDEKKSSNKRGFRGNYWLYPDVVGMEDLGADWCQEVKNCVHQYSDNRTKLWSFEVKLLINRSNVRESFFQAVSNSSWANFGYLVAAEVEGDETLKELRILFGAHGIGLIKLDIENPSESQIMIPAKERREIDWNTVNRLAEENKDFLEYVKLLKQFYQTGEVRTKDWDILENESFIHTYS